MKKGSQNPSKRSIGLRLAAYLFSVLALINPVVPAFANILDNATIQKDFNNDPFYLSGGQSTYQFETPQFIEWPQGTTKSLESVYDDLVRTHSQAISEPTLVPIMMGGITIFIPTYTRYNYIGTPAAQSRYVRTQLEALLGRSLYKHNSEAALINELFNRGTQYIKDSGKRYGDNLPFNPITSANQIPGDLIMPELRRINGKDVIVPIVYLTPETVSQYKVTGITVEFPGSVQFKSLSFANTSAKAARDAFIDVTGDISLTNSTLTTDEGSLEILSGGHFDNASSIVKAEKDLIIGAKKITNRTIVYRYDMGQDQGTHFGAIAALVSSDGNVLLETEIDEGEDFKLVLESGSSDIVIQGAKISAPKGQIKLDSAGNIFVSQIEEYNSSTSRFGTGTQSRSELSFLQSQIGAEGTILLIAKGQIAISAAEIVSDSGHLALIAGMGVSVLDAEGRVQSTASGKFGKTKIQESSYLTYAMRSLLDAGKGLVIHTEYGNINLKAADITTTEGTKLNAPKGSINLLMSQEQDHYNFSSVKKSLLTVKTESRGHEIKTGVPNSIVGGLSIEATQSLNIKFTGDPDAPLDEQIASMAKLPGFGYLGDLYCGTGGTGELCSDYSGSVIDTPDGVDWLAVADEFKEWDESKTSLSPAAMAIIAIAVAVATAGAGVAAASGQFLAGSVGLGGSATAAAAFGAATVSLISQATITAANGAVNGDIGGAMEEMVSSDDLWQNMATAALTAGVMEAVNGEFFNEVTPDTTVTPSSFVETIEQGGKQVHKLSLLGQTAQVVTQSFVSAAASTLIFEDGDFGNFEDTFKQSLAANAINALGEAMAEKIGNQFDLDKNPDGGNTALKYIFHAAAGCLVGVATASANDALGDKFDENGSPIPEGSSTDKSEGCVASAGGAVAGEFFAEKFRSKEDVIEAQDALEEFVDSYDTKVEKIQALDSEITRDQARKLLNEQGKAFAKEAKRLASRGVQMSKFAAAVGAFIAGADEHGINLAAGSAERTAEHNAFLWIYDTAHAVLSFAIDGEVPDSLTEPVGKREKQLDDTIEALKDAAILSDEAFNLLVDNTLSDYPFLGGLVKEGVSLSTQAGIFAAALDSLYPWVIYEDVMTRSMVASYLGLVEGEGELSKELFNANIARVELEVEGFFGALEYAVENLSSWPPPILTTLAEAAVGDPEAEFQVARVTGGLLLSHTFAPVSAGGSLVLMAPGLSKSLNRLKQTNPDLYDEVFEQAGSQIESLGIDKDSGLQTVKNFKSGSKRDIEQADTFEGAVDQVVDDLNLAGANRVFSKEFGESVIESASRPISKQGNVTQAQRKMQRRLSDPDRGVNDPFAGIKPAEAADLVKNIVNNADTKVSGEIMLGAGGVKGISGDVLGKPGSIIFREQQGLLVTEKGEFITFIDKARSWPLKTGSEKK